MLKKLNDYIARRKTELAARLTHKQSGVTAGLVERGPVATGHVTVQMRPVDKPGGASVCDCDERGVGCSHWETVHEDSNLVVTQAEQIMAQMAIGAANSALSYIELGDPLAPANTPTLADIALQQTTGQRKAVSLVAAGNIVTAEATWASGEGNGFTYTEAGLFNGILGSGLMFARKVFAGITKTSAFEMRFTWLITFLVNTQGGECAGISLIGPSSVSSFTVYNAGTDTGGAGGEASVAATFDFAVGANNIDVFLNGVRQVPGVDYIEVAAGALAAPIGGPPLNKGINFTGFTLKVAPVVDQVFLIQRTLA